MHALFVLVLILSLAACGLRRGEAPVADASTQCYVPCTPSLTDTGTRWEGDATDPAAWDDLGGRVVPELSGKLLQCESRRQACAGFITDLKKRGVIRAK
jgi:predicted small lipoprotein YifL